MSFHTTLSSAVVLLLLVIRSANATPLLFATRLLSTPANNTGTIVECAEGPARHQNDILHTDNLNSAENEVASEQSLEAMQQLQQIATIKQKMITDVRVNMTVPQLVRHYGYGAEVHHVITEDGYILELHRVLAKTPNNCGNSRRNNKKNKKMCQPVLLQHGLLGSSSAWVLNVPSKALAYMMADRGYDVWMGNARGNIYSMNHTKLNIKSKQFWQFSFDEMGKFDLRAVIDYVLHTTKYKKLHYVGHSMGTTMFWVLDNTHPGYTPSRVASMTALGPVAFVDHTRSPIKALAIYNREINWVLNLIHEYRILNPNFVMSRLTQKFCSLNKLTEFACSNAVFMLIGFDNNDLNLDWMPVIINQLNAGTSARTLVHFAQMIESGNFCKFDYHNSNKAHYNHTHPPRYYLSKVTVPVLLKWGRNDYLADPKDVAHLRRRLTKAKFINSVVNNPNFNHLDFLWGTDAGDLVYKDIFNFMEKHQ